MEALEQQIQALLAVLIALIVSQITSFIRSHQNRKLIAAAKSDIAAATQTIEQERETARAYREKNEEDAKALQIRITQEALDRNVQLMTTLREEREEHKSNLAEWREDRNEWKKERVERDKQIATLDKAYNVLKLEFEAVKRELEHVREESSDRELVIRDQSKTIEAQAETIRRHEQTITQQTARITALEGQVKELEKRNAEAPATPSLVNDDKELGQKLLAEVKRATDKYPKVVPKDEPPKEAG